MKFPKLLKIDNGKYYLLLFAAALIIYWPLSLNIFSLKNDAVTYFLPWRYHVSEAIQNGYFPFWSPYLYTGLPLHADIQSGVWNPVVFVISIFTKYNMSMLQWETLLYMIIGALGFFKLCRFFLFHKNVCLLLSISYMCCGFMVDSGSFIPWITSAAYIPFVLLFFLNIIQRPNLYNSVRLSLGLSLLFLAGYTSFFIFTAYILLIVSIVHLAVSFFNKKKTPAFKLLTFLAIAGVIAMVICSPALISYIEFFHYYNRGNGVSSGVAASNPFAFTNTISYILPQASYKLHTPNDITARNAYVGLLPLLFFVYSFAFRYSRYQKIILIATIISFLFSLGAATPVQGLFYHVLPLMNTFRHPAAMRLFTSTGILLLAGFGFHQGIKSAPRFSFRRLLQLSMIILAGFIVYMGLAKGDFEGSSFSHFSLNIAELKSFLDSSSFTEWVLISGIIQLIFLLIFTLVKTRKLLFIAAVVNLMMMTFLSMPFTLVSQHRSPELNAFINSFPPGFPPTRAWQDVENNSDDSSAISTYGYRDFYTKNISIQDHVITPTLNWRYGLFLHDSALRNAVSRHKFGYVDGADSTALEKFSPNGFTFRVHVHKSAIFHVAQQYNHNWEAFVNGKAAPVTLDRIAFMKVLVPAGVDQIVFAYRPAAVILAGWVSLIAVILCIGLVIYFRRAIT